MAKYLGLFFLIITLSAAGQISHSTKSKEFPLPLKFDVVGHGVELAPLLLQYDMESSQGRSLRMGNIKISSDTFFANLVPANRLDSRLSKALPREELNDWVFLLQWPAYLMEEGTLELISRTGRVLWNAKVGPKELENWNSQLSIWRGILRKGGHSNEDISNFPLFKFQYGIRQAQNSERTPFWTIREPFRICFSQIVSKGQTRLCSSQYQVLRYRKSIRLALVPLSEAPPRVILMNASGKLADKIAVPMDKPVQFYAELRSGLSYEFVAYPRKINIVDMIQLPKKQAAIMTIESDLSPLTKSTLLNKTQTPEWVEWLGWQQTIGDFRKYWKAQIPLSENYIMVPGHGGGAFKQDMTITKLPTEEMRPYLHQRTIRGTYIDGAPIKGRKPANVTVTSAQNSVAQDSDKADEFIWKFGAKDKGDYNRSYISVSDGENTFPAYHEVYKGFSTEISSRLTAVIGASSGETSNPQMTVMGEIAINHWFESILGWTNYWASKQRWGASLKAFRSFTDLEISNRKSTLTAYTGELKYRLNPGLWSRDETWGLIGGYQSVSFEKFQGEMLGVGVFWGRSMPQIFEPLINWLSFFDYPKWVDMEFIYYPVSTNVNVLGRSGIGNWALNFHGQIMFTDYFFGEAGFGLKQYDISNEAEKVRGAVPNLSFTASYGTMGLGFRF